MVAISGPQLRAARGMLDWTREQLAKEAGISQETVKNIEHGIFRPQESTTEAIIRAFSVHDVVFTTDNGVKLANNTIVTLDGYESFKSFMDDLYTHAKSSEALVGQKTICVCNVDNNIFKKYLRDYTSLHVDRMSKIKGLKIRALATRKEIGQSTVSGYLEYRYIPENKSLPFYVFGDKLAIINFDVENAPRIILIKSSTVADSYRSQFDVMWQHATTSCK